MASYAKSRNDLLQVYRYLFTIVIALHHFNETMGYDYMNHGYIAVEFFFMMSGYFLYKSFIYEKKHSVLAYVRKRLKRLFPAYFMACLSWGIVMILKRNLSIKKLFVEILMLQNVGFIQGGGYNYPCWYISVLICASGLLYLVLKEIPHNYVKVFFPILILMSYTYFFGLDTGIESWKTIGGVYMPLLRGGTDMSVGILIAELQEMAERKIPLKLEISAEIGALVVIIIGIIGQENIDNIVIIAYAILIYFSALQNGFITSQCAHLNGEVAYIMYLNHAMMGGIIALFLKRLEIHHACIGSILYLICLILFSIFVNKFINCLMKISKKRILAKKNE